MRKGAKKNELSERAGGGNFVLPARLRRHACMATVSRRDRLNDLAALVLICAGIALYLDAGARLRTISGYTYQNPGPRGQSAVMAADWARRESYGGLALTMLGCVAGVASALRHARGTPQLVS